MYSELTLFMQWMMANYLKRESNSNKKWNLVRLEHGILRLVAFRFTDWTIAPLDASVLQINPLHAMNDGKLFKKRKQFK